ncbi:unnamed protein product [Cylicostephanus goldi]|uniref:Uncharacterized protein n=1 Tax=Cylicostephanus goldi TaxID=71465 RepID=A0A3P7Q5M4_CYLGO|nr:unnamed protein product [Cylicostephanus goldi]
MDEKESKASSPASDFSEELNVTPPPTNTTLLNGGISEEKFGRPVMTSTQRPGLFLSQAVHARNELFPNESSPKPIENLQKPKIYHEETTYNFFSTKPAKTFDKRGDKKADAPWLDLPPKRRKSKVKVETPEQQAYVLPSTPADDDNYKTPRRGPKVEVTIHFLSGLFHIS